MNNDKKHLLKNLVLNPKTSCSIDEAVGMMLGLLKGADWCIDVNYSTSCFEYERATGEKLDDSFDLSECLATMRNELQSAYWDAEEANEPLEQHLTAIETFDTDYMKKAKVYLCLVEDELAKGAESKLRAIVNEHGVKRITLASLDEWWAKQKDKPLEQSIFQDMQHNVPPVTTNDEEDKELSLGANVTFGLLLWAFVKQSNEFEITDYGTPSNVNKSKVYEHLVEILSELCDSEYRQGDTSIRKRLATAQTALNEHIRKHS